MSDVLTLPGEQEEVLSSEMLSKRKRLYEASLVRRWALTQQCQDTAFVSAP